MFSPASIVKQSLLEESTSLHSLMSTENTPEPSAYEDIDIEAVISEKTKVQHRSLYLTNPSCRPNTLDRNELNLYMPENVYNKQTNVDTKHTAFRDITNLESPRTFARLNADRLKTIAEVNELACDNNTQLIAPKSVLANALADHIYKVTNQKPSTSRIDEILTNKIMTSNVKKENQWNWAQDENDSKENIQSNEMFSDDYYNMFNR